MLFSDDPFIICFDIETLQILIHVCQPWKLNLYTSSLILHPFSRYGYLKKIIEEVNAQEDTKKLLQFCSWENPTFSHAVLYELLWQVAIAYTYELRPYLDLLLNILLMEDSWQLIRIKKTLKGIPDEHTAREGEFTFTNHRWRCCLIQIFFVP